MFKSGYEPLSLSLQRREFLRRAGGLAAARFVLPTAPGISVSACGGDRYAMVRSVSHRNSNHTPMIYYTLTGRDTEFPDRDIDVRPPAKNRFSTLRFDCVPRSPRTGCIARLRRDSGCCGLRDIQSLQLSADGGEGAITTCLYIVVQALVANCGCIAWVPTVLSSMRLLSWR